MDTIEDKRSAELIVDGGSFFMSVMRALGIGEVNEREIINVCHEVISADLGQDVPIRLSYYVTAAENPDRFKKKWEAAKFRFVPVAAERDGSAADDKKINEIITSVNPAHTRVLIVITTDVLDFLVRLKGRAQLGIKVFIAAANIMEDGRRPLSLASQEAMEREGFSFIDLEPYKDRLMRRPWIERERPATKRKISATIEYSLGGDRDAGRLVFFERMSAYIQKHGLLEFNLQFELARITMSIEVPEDKQTFDGFFLMMANCIRSLGIENFNIRSVEDMRPSRT